MELSPKAKSRKQLLVHGDFLVDVVKGHRGLDIKWRGQEYNPEDCWTKKIEDCRASPCSEKASSRTQTRFSEWKHIHTLPLKWEGVLGKSPIDLRSEVK